jgi:hypothetical protein
MLNTSRALLAALAAVVVAGSAWGGIYFRLDIGSPNADRSAAKVKDAVLLVRGLACDDDSSIVITGTAEGVVNGSRQTIPLALARLATPGVYAVTRQWPDGRWVLHLNATCPGRKAAASAVVPVERNTRFARSKARFFLHTAAAADVDSMLQTMARGD